MRYSSNFDDACPDVAIARRNLGMSDEKNSVIDASENGRRNTTAARRFALVRYRSADRPGDCRSRECGKVDARATADPILQAGLPGG
ncbi:hypothetical protein MPLB_40030 [Mesorhizobium sp. ORS 3324]|nr:hypothetical protein MPLB_40030 [Mesorhizobium sp. ORS 3324]CDX33534.1 hypothetical protein MPLA_1650109 [Mesorhizobium sp. ORS 3359]